MTTGTGNDDDQAGRTTWRAALTRWRDDLRHDLARRDDPRRRWRAVVAGAYCGLAYVMVYPAGAVAAGAVVGALAFWQWERERSLTLWYDALDDLDEWHALALDLSAALNRAVDQAQGGKELAAEAVDLLERVTTRAAVDDQRGRRGRGGRPRGAYGGLASTSYPNGVMPEADWPALRARALTDLDAGRGLSGAARDYGVETSSLRSRLDREGYDTRAGA